MEKPMIIQLEPAKYPTHIRDVERALDKITTDDPEWDRHPANMDWDTR